MDPSTKPASKRRRQRSPSPPAPRKKSCEACRKAKARCNTALPQCSRCQRKGIPCDYGGTRNEGGPDQGDSGQTNRSAGNADNLFPLLANEFEQVNMLLEDPDAPFSLAPFVPAHIVNIPAPAGNPVGTEFRQNEDSVNSVSGGSTLEGVLGYQGDDSSQSPDSLHNFAVDPTLQNQPRGPAPGPVGSDSNSKVRQLPFHMITTFREDGSKQIEIYPNENGEDYNPRFFGFSNDWTPACTLSANRVLGAFKIWPKRMVRGDDLPPFIHPHFPGMRVSPIAALTKRPLGRQYFGQPPKLPEALANCSLICTMFYNKTPENTGFVWKNIKREQERIYANFSKWDARDCLSAYQAMIIYSFLRLVDGENEHNNFDMAFILTMGEISAGLWSNQLRELQIRSRELDDITWQDWMMAESACRTGIVFMFIFILLGLYKVIPPTQGCKGLDGMPVPCGRKLWMARDQEEWEREYQVYRLSRKSDKPITFQDLTAMAEDSVHEISPEHRADIEAWAADLDEFGNLVLIGGLAGPGSNLEDYRRMHIDVNIA